MDLNLVLDCWPKQPPDDKVQVFVKSPYAGVQGECVVSIVVGFYTHSLLIFAALSLRHIFVSHFSLPLMVLFSHPSVGWHSMAPCRLIAALSLPRYLVYQLTTRSRASHPKRCIPSLLSLSMVTNFWTIYSSKFIHWITLLRWTIGFTTSFG
jgi:hypothetical protein